MDYTEFDDIRPYNEDEIPAAMNRIANSGSFPLLASFIYPDQPLDQVRKRVASYTTVKEFQAETMAKVNERIIEETMTGFSCSGLERLSSEKHYLYVSNHRDIMLDSSLLQFHLIRHGFDTTEITFGANLMMNPLIVDIGKSNKMFRVERPGGNIKEFYRSSLHLSRYLRYVITEKGQSAWIAQRNGRTKDGMDRTDPSLIKMLCMSDDREKIKAIADLNIVPVSISYEWEPCDILKSLELFSSQFSKYTKKPGEDLNSIMTGLLQPKGRVHLELCNPITHADLSRMDTLTNNEFHKAVGTLIDSRINPAYRLYPNNYIAHDMRYGNELYMDQYTQKEYDAFAAYVSQLDRFETGDQDKLKDIFLGIYSNPVDNR